MQLLETVSYRTLMVLGAGALVFIGSRKGEPRVELVLSPPPEVNDVMASHDDDPPPPPVATVDLTFTADGETWLAISELSPDDVTSRGHVRMVEDDGVFATITPVVKLSAPAWNGREVVVDGGCREALHDFALVRRVTGDPSYASEKPALGWTARLIAEHADVVVAAKLSHCKGAFASTGTTTRMTNFDDPLVIERAWNVLRTSEFAAKAAQEWKSASEPNAWTHDVVVDSIVARDRRGVTWVSSHVHTNGIGCGAPSANFWGLFRVRADRTVEQVALREIDAGSLDAMIDVGGATPVMLGTAMLPIGPTVMDADGVVEASAQVQFFGCPC